MSLYPSLEDMKVGQLMQVQAEAQPAPAHPGYPAASLLFSTPSAPNPYALPMETMTFPQKLDLVYPSLHDMGLALTEEEMNMIKSSNAVAVRASNQVQVQSFGPGSQAMVAPLSGSSLGLHRAQVTHGIREVVLCKGKDGKTGLRMHAINKGVFVVLVHKDSPAAMVGLRFGDQILQINEENMAGYSMTKVHDLMKKCPNNGIKVVVRDRPFERTVTLHKDSTGHTGFSFKSGKINAIVKDSSAARNGLLTEHNLLEVNGQNVVGMDDKNVRKIIESGVDIVTLTIMPSFVFNHLLKHMASSLVKKLMDHSVPDV